MYSPVAVAGSISLVIRSTPAGSDQITFISSSASVFTVSSARTIGRPSPRASSSVRWTEAGCTVSPLASITPFVSRSRAHHSE